MSAGAGTIRISLLLLLLISFIILMQQFELGRSILAYVLILLIILTLVKNSGVIADVLSPPSS